MHVSPLFKERALNRVADTLSRAARKAAHAADNARYERWKHEHPGVSKTSAWRAA